MTDEKMLQSDIIDLHRELERKNGLIAQLIEHCAHMDAVVEFERWQAYPGAQLDDVKDAVDNANESWRALPDGLKVAIESKYEEIYCGGDGE